jgi:peptide deformylase
LQNRKETNLVAILPIYTYGQPVLRRRAKPIKSVDDNLRKFVDDMFDTMHHANGVGLAANQVGSLDRVIVIDITDAEERKHEGVGEAADRLHQGSVRQQPKMFALINPEIITSEGSWKMEEGCLSIPEIRDEIERAEKVTVRYKDLEWRTQEVEAEGLLGRVILHEIDHLNGVLFIDHLGTVKRKLLRGRLNKIENGLVDVSYPVMTARDLVAASK